MCSIGTRADYGGFDMAKRNWVNKPEPGENANRLKHTMTIAKWDLIDVTDKNEVTERIEQYFDQCITDDILPTVEGLALALGTNRTAMFGWKTNGKVPIEIVGLVDRAVSILNADQATNIANSGNVVGQIFLMKNRFEDYTDRREVVHRVEQPQLTQKELIEKAKQLPGF